jgi:Sec-independent protein translocase protein TatA
MVFDSISWGETVVVTGVALMLVGRKDLPVASRFVGTQLGRVVGLLQGARIRADRFAQHHELKALQNELRSGLRELDMVKSELATATANVAGRGLGSTIGGGINRKIPANNPQNTSFSNKTSSTTALDSTATSISNTLTMEGKRAEANILTSSSVKSSPITEQNANELSANNNLPLNNLSERSHSVRAVAEEEWERRGIGFKSRAEQQQIGGDGSALLSNIIQQSLIHDQYERAMHEQDMVLKKRGQEVEKKIKKNE